MQNPSVISSTNVASVLLIGAGVVGRAIAETHHSRGIPFWLADQDRAELDQFAGQLRGLGARVSTEELLDGELHAIQVGDGAPLGPGTAPIVIESITERVEAKQQLFSAIQAQFGEDAVLCTNTSTLQIDDIAGDRMSAPDRVCGLHFFMPVHARSAVEVIAGKRTADDALETATRHAKQIGKLPIRCQDGPGFIVNRMLSPYLNQALLLLCRGATESQLRRAAIAYGMPMSPLELIDWIGTPTMYHAGRAFCNAFPKRMNPSPMVPALVKRKRFGRSNGRGLYDYEGGCRGESLAEATQQLIEMYRTDSHRFSDGDVLQLLSIPMWIEANALLQAGVADSMQTVDMAMAGGLGYTAHSSWSTFFSELGRQRIADAAERWHETFRIMAPV